jgi:hypothetical protein
MHPKLYAHPVANWPFPQWLPYPYVAPQGDAKIIKEEKLLGSSPW